MASIDVSEDIPNVGGINSADATSGILAIAVDNADSSQNGYIAFYKVNGSPQKIKNGTNFIEVGNLPDAVIPDNFNASNYDNEFDDRSDDRGP